MFKPKLYEKDGKKVYRLIGTDASDFFYDGELHFKEDRLFTDNEERCFYQVTTELQPGIKFYIELEPVATRITTMEEKPPEKKFKDTAWLIKASPTEPNVPEKVKETEPEKAHGIETAIKDEEAKIPEVEAKETAKEPSIVEAVLQKEPVLSVEAEEKEIIKEFGSPVEEPIFENDVNEMLPKKGISLTKALAALLFIGLIAIAGAFILNPGVFSNILPQKFLPTPLPEITPTPAPEPTITPSPSAAPTPVPSPAGLYESMIMIALSIDHNNESVIKFAGDHISQSSKNSGNKLAMFLDVYDHVNKNWVETAATDGPPALASQSISAMKGSNKDYSALISALAISSGVDSRVLLTFNGDVIDTHPQIKIASNASEYENALELLSGRYGVSEPYVDIDGNDRWATISITGKPGITIAGNEKYVIYPDGEIERIS